MARVIIFLYKFPTTLCYGVIGTHVSRVAPCPGTFFKDAPPTELQRRGKGANLNLCFSTNLERAFKSGFDVRGAGQQERQVHQLLRRRLGLHPHRQLRGQSYPDVLMCSLHLYQIFHFSELLTRIDRSLVMSPCPTSGFRRF